MTEAPRPNLDPLADLNWRYATKSFDHKRKIKAHDLDLIKESLRLTPSSFGLQPWGFVLLESQGIKDQLLESTFDQKQVVEASHTVVLCRKKSFNQEDLTKAIDDLAHQRQHPRHELARYQSTIAAFISRFNPEQLNHWLTCQVYIALGQLMAVCARLRLDSCPMEGFRRQDYDDILKLGDQGLTAVVLCAVGYRSQDDQHGELAKVRWPQDQLIRTL